jgi:NAD(P)H-hydrate repair Nnr-like enzyme with NAD(P)H-hydrate dehydratase domain
VYLIGLKDIIAQHVQGHDSYVGVSTEEGCPRRCGGQGDILAGCIGVAMHWALQVRSLLINMHMYMHICITKNALYY